MSQTTCSSEATRGDTSGVVTATLFDVDIRWELEMRPRRLPNYERENGALAVLAAEMSANPHNMLQKLVEVAADLCAADTAGISLLDGEVFRWEAVAGVFAGARGGTMPRDHSPCGVCIDRNATQLMHLADRCFPALLAQPRFVEAMLVPFHDHGTPVGTVWIVSHRAERKFDKEDERVVRGLAHLASAGWQLWKAYEASERAGRLKDDFLATLGHELRTPLGAITAAASVLRQRVAEDHGANRALDVIARQSLHVSRLVEDLLDVERISQGKLHIKKRVIDLRTLVAQTIEERRAQIERRHLLSVELSAEPVWVDADPVRLSQVMSNLLDNATKYTPDAGQISVAITVHTDQVQVEVRDTGIGMPLDQLTGVFEPFVQLSDRGEASSGGLGIGLAVVRRLTELHGGTVHATSPGPGLGSTFIIRLPISQHARTGGVAVRPPVSRC